jgi:hypothetical protein
MLAVLLDIDMRRAYALSKRNSNSDGEGDHKAKSKSDDNDFPPLSRRVHVKAFVFATPPTFSPAGGASALLTCICVVFVLLPS